MSSFRVWSGNFNWVVSFGLSDFGLGLGSGSNGGDDGELGVEFVLVVGSPLVAGAVIHSLLALS